MALPGGKPQKGQQRLKLFLWGPAKVGKSLAACQFPNSFYIDTEAGAVEDQYVEALLKAESRYLQTDEFDELLAAVHALMAEEHPYHTLVLDPISTIYAQLVELGEAAKGDSYNKHREYAESRVKSLFRLLLNRLDMNVVVTSHAKPEYVDSEPSGHTIPDDWKKALYPFDLLLELRLAGTQRYAEVRGTRLEQFQDGERFPWSYEEFVKRLGQERLEKPAERQELIDVSQLQVLKALVAEHAVMPATQSKWFQKAKATGLHDLPADVAARLIQYLESRREVLPK